MKFVYFKDVDSEDVAISLERITSITTMNDEVRIETIESTWFVKGDFTSIVKRIEDIVNQSKVDELFVKLLSVEEPRVKTKAKIKA